MLQKHMLTILGISVMGAWLHGMKKGSTTTLSKNKRSFAV